MSVEADYTPPDLDIRVKRGSHTPILFTFSDDGGALDLTDYSQPRMLIAARRADSAVRINGAITDAAAGRVSVILNTAAWASLSSIKGGAWQLDMLDASDHPVILIGGMLTIEGSLT